MFEQLNELMDQLLKVETDFAKYKNAKDARKLLQLIKVESQTLRKKINDLFHDSKKKD